MTEGLEAPPSPPGEEIAQASGAAASDEGKDNIIDGRYEVLSILGEGGFGVVYKARQISTGQIVAVKLLHADLIDDEEHGEEYAARFEREMQLIGSLKHPNVVRLIDKGRLDNGELFMVLEYIEGRSLFDVIETEGPLNLKQTFHVMGQVLDALHAAHAIGIVHRDLKPHNIMLTRTGYRLNATVLDFGIAGVVEGQRGVDYRTLTKASEIRGTPHYMAPEQLRAKTLTPQSDLYAWGLVFIESLTGYPAVDGESPFDVALTQVGDDPVQIPEGIMSDALYDIVEGCTRKPLDERFKNAEEVFVEIDKITGLGTPKTADIAFDELATSDDLETDLARSRGETPSRMDLASADTAIFSDEEIDAYEAQHSTPPPRVNAGELGLENRRVTLRGKSSSKGGVPLWAFAVVLALALVGVGFAVYTLVDGSASSDDSTADEGGPDFAEAERLAALEPSFDNTQKALDEYRRILDDHPDNPRAKAGLAYQLATMARYGWMSPQATWPDVKKAAESALAEDGDLPAAHAALAMARLYAERDYQGADSAFKRAVELNPTYGPTYAEQLLAPLGRFKEAQAQIDGSASGASEADRDLASATLAYFEGKYSDAVRAATSALDSRPDSFLARYRLGLVYAALGEYSKAAGELETARRLQDESMVVGMLGYVNAVQGNDQKAHALLDLLSARQGVDGRVLPEHIGIIHMGLGDTDEAMSWISKGFDVSSAVTPTLLEDPLLAPLRKLPQFDVLVTRAGLER